MRDAMKENMYDAMTTGQVLLSTKNVEVTCYCKMCGIHSGGYAYCSEPCYTKGEGLSKWKQ